MILRQQILVVVLALLPGCASPAGDVAAMPAGTLSPVPDADVLMQADREFAADTAARRLDGWLHWFDPNAAKVPPAGDVVQGLDAIRSADGPMFANPALMLHWEPDVAAWLEPDTLGFTRGRYRLVQTADDGTEQDLGTGVYLTLWKRSPDGWRVLLDTGIPDA